MHKRDIGNFNNPFTFANAIIDAGPAYGHLLAAEHPYECKCFPCREFWRTHGPDPDTGLYGPFGATIDREGDINHDG